MSAYIMLAEQSPLAAPAFTTADAVTAPSSFDNSDFLGLGGFNADEWNISPLSPSFSWNPKLDAAPFATVNLERDLKVSSTTAAVRNGQPTPPLDDSNISNNNINNINNNNTYNNNNNNNNIFSTPGSYSMANFSHNAWDDTPTPPSSDDRAGSGDLPKRRRLRGAHKPSIATTTTTISSSGIDSDDQMQDSHQHHPRRRNEQRHERVKREKFLERNRLAASKCRQKKKEHTQLLEARFREASHRRESLNAEISRLRGEVLGLKNEVLRHAQCGDEPIKLHLAQMVKQIANKDRDEPLPIASGGGGMTDGSIEQHQHQQQQRPLPDTDRSPSSIRDSVSFGFDDPMHSMDSAASLEQQIRRESEASIALSADDDFNDLINV